MSATVKLYKRFTYENILLDVEGYSPTGTADDISNEQSVVDVLAIFCANRVGLVTVEVVHYDAKTGHFTANVSITFELDAQEKVGQCALFGTALPVLTVSKN